MEIFQPRCFATSTTGARRPISTSGGTGSDRGLLEAAPMSRASAPSSMSLPACASAASGSRNRPPSENESSVILSIPKMPVIASGRSRYRLRFRSDGDGRLPRTAGLRHCSRWTLLRLRLGLLIRGANRTLAAQESVNLVARQRLIFEQAFGEGVQVVDAILQNLFGPIVGLLDDPANFGIDLLRGCFGHVLRPRYRMAEEDLLLVFAISDGAEFIGHTEARDHRACHTRGHFNIGLRARGHLVVAEDQLFRDAAAKRHAKIGIQLLPRPGQLVALG